MAVPCKIEIPTSGNLPFSLFKPFCYFQSAIPAKSSVHTNFRRVHLNRKLFFLAGFDILRVCTAKRNRENAVFFSICLDVLMMASDCFIVFVCALHWNCAVHAIWPQAPAEIPCRKPSENGRWVPNFLSHESLIHENLCNSKCISHYLFFGRLRGGWNSTYWT